MEPYYVIMRLPGETKEEFMLMLPFTPAKRQNMVAWMSAKSDGADYGKRLVYRFPKDKLIYGPEQIHARLNQDPVISAQLTLLNQRGSSVVFGNLLVIPIEKSMIYVQPLYLLAQSEPDPAAQVRHRRDRHFAVDAADVGRGADARLLRAGHTHRRHNCADDHPADDFAGRPDDDPAAGRCRAGKEANDHYTKAQDALKIADWTTYGAEMKLLQQALDQAGASDGTKIVR